MRKRLNPSQVLILGFFSFILAGALLLMLPFSTTSGISFVDAVFTSTSAVCVTGLIVKDTPNDFTLIGQIIIMLLIQLGGLGYMTSATIISLMIGKRIGLGERLIMKDALNVLDLEGIVKFTKAVLLTTLIFEATGALLLFIRFSSDFPLITALYYGIFHAVSAFNNAGFSLFSDNLMRYRGDIIVNIVITFLIVIGGIGFIVISDFYNLYTKKVMRFSTHTKIVIVTTVFLIIAGAFVIFFLEYQNPKTFRMMPLKESVMSSYFSSVTPRTAGFNTIDYSLVRPETLLFVIMLMFIGASPGGTGGGVKTTTIAIVYASLLSTVRSMRDTVLFKRRIPVEIVSKSLMLIIFAMLLILLISFLVIRIENTFYLPTLFEVTSAFGTVGLSVGDGGVRSLSALFTDPGKLLVSLMMFIGRLGPLTLAVAVISKKEMRFRYPEGRVVIG